MEKSKQENKRTSKKIKVAPYIRVSTQMHAGDITKKPRVAAYVRTKAPSNSTLFPDINQTEYFDALIKSNPAWEFAGIYADYGRNGMTVKNRLEFLRIIEDAKAGKIDVILTKSVSRFTKNTNDFLKYTKLLKGLGVEVCFECEMLSTMDNMYDKLADSWSAFLKEQSREGERAWK